jgi:hypothetical protein
MALLGIAGIQGPLGLPVMTGLRVAEPAGAPPQHPAKHCGALTCDASPPGAAMRISARSLPSDIADDHGATSEWAVDRGARIAGAR